MFTCCLAARVYRHGWCLLNLGNSQLIGLVATIGSLLKVLVLSAIFKR